MHITNFLRRAAFLVVVLVGFGLSSAAAQSGARVALVIGNAAYAELAPLSNPARDAAAVGEALRQAGYSTVLVATDLGGDRLHQTLEAFAQLANDADWAVIYYSGHGVEMEGTHYILPIDSKPSTIEDIYNQGIPVEQLLAATAGGTAVRLIMLDADRRNPFPADPDAMDPDEAFAQMLSGSPGTVVLFSAATGQPALAGTDLGTGPFAGAVVAGLAQRGAELSIFLRGVASTVAAVTGNQQRPTSYGALPIRQFFITPP